MLNIPLLFDGELRDLGRVAGRAIVSIYDAYLKGDTTFISSKADASPLTAADLASHKVIVSGLKKLTPEIPVVSEEDTISHSLRKPSGAFWLIDPLDGTKEFVNKNGDFTVNIALIVDGEPIWGLVYAPVLDLLYWGGRSYGAWLDVHGVLQQLTVSSMPNSGDVWRVVASKSHMNQETENFIQALGATTLVQAGSSLKLCRVAEGSADIYPRLGPTCEWDTAAAQAVVEGAGGQVYDLSGMSLRYGKPDVLNPYFVVSKEILVGV